MLRFILYSDGQFDPRARTFQPVRPRNAWKPARAREPRIIIHTDEHVLNIPTSNVFTTLQRIRFAHWPFFFFFNFLYN